MNKSSQNSIRLLCILSLMISSSYSLKAQLNGFLNTNTAFLDQSIQFGNQNKILTLGLLQGTSDLDPGIGVFNLSSVERSSYLSIVDSNGLFVNAVKLAEPSSGSSNSFTAREVKQDQSGNYYVIGEFRGQVDFNVGSGLDSYSAQNNDPILIKLNAALQYQWAKQLVGTDRGYAYSIELDLQKNIYLFGNFDGTMDFNPDPVQTSTLTSFSRGLDAYLCRLDSTGTFQWVKHFKPDNSLNNGVNALELEIDVSTNEIYFSFAISGLTDLDPSPTASFYLPSTVNVGIVKLSTAGQFIWAVGFENCNSSYNNFHYKNGRMVLGGTFFVSFDADPGSGSVNLTSNGFPGDLFAVVLNTSGNYLSHQTIVSSNPKSMNSVQLDDFGNAYLYGSFQNTILVAQPPSAAFLNTSSNSNYGLFYTMYNPNGQLLWAGELGNNNSIQANQLMVSSPGSIYTLGSVFDSLTFDLGTSNFQLNTNGSRVNYLYKIGSKLSVGLDKIESNPIFKLYPNPSQSDFTLESSGEEILQIRMFDLLGRENVIGIQKQGNQYHISTDQLSSGLYLIALSLPGKQRIKKLVIE